MPKVTVRLARVNDNAWNAVVFHTFGEIVRSNSQPTVHDVWAKGELYEPYVGRWSRLVAEEFLRWLGLPAGGRWLDVGCGTGALSETILRLASPASVTGVDQARGYVDYVRRRLPDSRCTFVRGSAESLVFQAAVFDAAVSGLVLNFVPHPEKAMAEMRRVTVPGGMVAVYLWDYAGKMEFMRYFWDAAIALDRNAVELDEGRRFPLCTPKALEQAFADASLRRVQVRAIDVETTFRDFDDYWLPFLGGQGPAPSYTMSLTHAARGTLRDRLRTTLPLREDGSIRLTARAWAAQGVT